MQFKIQKMKSDKNVPYTYDVHARAHTHTHTELRGGECSLKSLVS